MSILKKKQNNIQQITIEIKDHLSAVVELFQSIRKPMMDTTLNGMKLMVDHDDCTEDEFDRCYAQMLNDMYYFSSAVNSLVAFTTDLDFKTLLSMVENMEALFKMSELDKNMLTQEKIVQTMKDKLSEDYYKVVYARYQMLKNDWPTRSKDDRE